MMMVVMMMIMRLGRLRLLLLLSAEPERILESLDDSADSLECTIRAMQRRANQSLQGVIAAAEQPTQHSDRVCPHRRVTHHSQLCRHLREVHSEVSHFRSPL